MKRFALSLLALVLSVSSAFAVNVLDFGAVPNDSGSDSAAFQAAQNAIVASGHQGELYIPCGDYVLSASINFGNEGFRVRGENRGCVRLFLNSGVYAFKVNVTVQVENGSFSEFTCIDAAMNSSSVCIAFQGTSGKIAYSRITGIACHGQAACIVNQRNVNSGGGEAGFDWNYIGNIQTTNHGPANTVYGIYFDHGSGTGNVYTDMNLITSGIAITFMGNNGTNIGDITIGNIQFGGDGTAIFLSGNGSYRARVTIANVQCDAGVDRCVFADRYDLLSLVGVALGGAASNQLIGLTRFYCGSAAC